MFGSKKKKEKNFPYLGRNSTNQNQTQKNPHIKNLYPKNLHTVFYSTKHRNNAGSGDLSIHSPNQVSKIELFFDFKFYFCEISEIVSATKLKDVEFGFFKKFLE